VRVLVGSSVFDGTVEVPAVLRLVHFAYERRHRVLVRSREAYLRWSEAHVAPRSAEVYAQGLDWSEEVETRDPARYELSVEAVSVNGLLDVQRAIERLERPFVLVVENDHSDRRFLEAVAPDECKDRLRELMRKSWLQCRARDGKRGIPKLIADGLSDTLGEAERFYVVFDSDLEAPGLLRAENQKVREACEALGVRHHMLARRTIENYLTRPALMGWVKRQENDAAGHTARVDALYGDWCAERPSRRHHYFMKRGLKNMARGAQYEGIPHDLEQTLLAGFGNAVTEAFDVAPLRENDLRDEGSWDELSDLVRDVLRCAQ